MGEANPYWIEIEHYHNFSRQRLTALLDQYGFDVVHYDIPFRYKAQMELYAVKRSLAMWSGYATLTRPTRLPPGNAQPKW